MDTEGGFGDDIASCRLSVASRTKPSMLSALTRLSMTAGVRPLDHTHMIPEYDRKSLLLGIPGLLIQIGFALLPSIAVAFGADPTARMPHRPNHP